MVLAGHGHQRRAYQLTNTELFTYDDSALLLGEVAGWTVIDRPTSTQEAVQVLIEGSMDAHPSGHDDWFLPCRHRQE